ncbi:transcriptional regulator [Bradyrhizobium sp. 1]|uniref:helix-turn-helix domain-containing protein n=1 Tax=Bradyrhizobium sp. 1 TaxID=241591 RepID=UPI001FF84965|nr:transcriptional regulator [Bradyrhizobium sp. 1]MCK1394362.1 transcriptional regulator [Bradyrhizobium sp. 1]
MLVITRQIKAARSLLGWEQHQLALQSGVAISTIRRLEGLKDAPIAAHFDTINKIRCAFERAGIEFLGHPAPGVRLKTTSMGDDRIL